MSLMSDDIAAVLGEIAAHAVRQKELEPVQRDCRRYARQIWREQPHLTIDEMLERNEIKLDACQGRHYVRKELEEWIKPDSNPHEELDYFSVLPLWKIEEACALWHDFNPFILLQSFQECNPSFWITAFHPNLRESFFLLLDRAQRCALSGQLATTKADNQFFVTPEDFYKWVTKSGETPDATRIINFFASLKEGWSSVDGNKKATRVEGKVREIRRILEAILSIDPAFDATSMPGRKEDFHNLCMQLNKSMFSIARTTFNDYLLGVCSFNAGARNTDYYSNMASKLG
jgi:hypothetical protein